ncbi:GSK3-beta interaction protein isoform X1 [Brienomyrus brachyistius]|uniref:GSK3-beta interaction protein isoform X1 n=1 Tax=Brienomyrus brachyistius TaxID=42636 RepID=UPI0020B2209F|nr:GSK3-beta interaction protein isoform X1 [Brienomyrus brachyistius]XP_048831073.1 GSK3-beta interaction protein isoform X1 [Brienomyrus brachyistius]
MTLFPGMSRMCGVDLSAEERMEVDCNQGDPTIDSIEDCVGDVKDMRLEAEAVVNDVLFAVAEMYVSQMLNNTLDVAYINVKTREGNRYCLELSEAGLRVVGYQFDQTVLLAEERILLKTAFVVKLSSAVLLFFPPTYICINLLCNCFEAEYFKLLSSNGTKS